MNELIEILEFLEQLENPNYDNIDNNIDDKICLFIDHSTIMEHSLTEKNIKLKTEGSESKMSIWVYPNDDGNIPHFHVERGKSSKFSCAIKLEKAEFFPHGLHKDILINDDCKTIDKIMDKPTTCKEYKGSTVWQACVKVWNNEVAKRQSKPKISDDIVKPDYSKMRN